MKVLAFAASNSSQSINRQLVMHAADVLREQVNNDAQIRVLDLNDFEMPLYSMDREQNDGIPQSAHRFFNAIGEADSLLISLAEHNGTYTAAYKNLFDWASRIDAKVYQGKRAVLLSTSPGQGGGASVLAQASESAPYFGMEVLASVALGRFQQVFEGGRLVDEPSAERLLEALKTMQDA